MNLTENVKKKEGFNQVCVWPACTLGEQSKEEFEKHMKEFMGIQTQFLEEVETGPDILNGEAIPETGGRHDIFFAIHDEDIPKFVLKRFQFSIRWLEDVLADCNYTSPIYPERIFEYCTWNKENLSRRR